MAKALIGILLDVSHSMRDNVGSGVDEDGGSWALSIFEAIDNLIKHDVSPDNSVFALAFGARGGDQLLDILMCLQSSKFDQKVTGDQLPSLQGDDYTVKCPICQQDSPVKKLTGNLSSAKCPKCDAEFYLKNVRDGNILALNISLTALRTQIFLVNHFLQAKYPKCKKAFELKDVPKGNILALNIYLTSLSK